MPLIAQLVLEPLRWLAPLAVLFQELPSLSATPVPQEADADAGVVERDRDARCHCLMDIYF
ncbi:hypothetical protein ACWEP4_06245 [Streptomyces sp. NPDC004227]